MFARMDQMGRTAWLGLTILGFYIAWPIGVAVIAYLAGTGRLRTWRTEFAGGAPGIWHNMRQDAEKATRRWKTATGGGTSGNAAFDEYRAAELSRLEAEEREFREFLDQLRRSRDRAEFDGFMAEQRRKKATATDVAA